MPTSVPPPPRVRLALSNDYTAESSASGGFVNVRRLELVATYPDGGRSAPFRYDIATREALDAVVVVAHFRNANRERRVFLRSAVRPPCALRPIPPVHDGLLWEVAAGLIDAGETPEEAAARELEEEIGFSVAPTSLCPLGPWSFPAPGLIGERHVFFHVDVDPSAQKVPTEDGSALERGASIIAIALGEALKLCKEGAIRDAKTELALRRLSELP